MTRIIEPENGLGDDEECSVMDLEPENGLGDGEDCPGDRESPLPSD